MKSVFTNHVLPCLCLALTATSYGQLPVQTPVVQASQPPAAPTSLIYKDPKAPVEKRVEDLLSQMTQDEKFTLIAGSRKWMGMRGVPRLDIPNFLMTDAGIGDRVYGHSTAYPGGLGLASTWDVDQAERDGTAQARDTRARGAVIILGPAMDLYRAPMCGRNFEYFGEDPVLAGNIASAYIKGAQGQGIGVTAKHFAANDQEVKRYTLNSEVDERTLRELDLKPFEICVKNGATGFMTSYNPLNGVYTSQNGWLINTVLKGEWKFTGMVMSDWGSCHSTEGIANGGLDLEMPNDNYFKPQNLLPLIAAGTIKQATIDDKVRRILRVAFTLGWFDRPLKDTSIPLDDPTSSEVALRGAREGVTLLKNTGNLLPLNPAAVKKIVVLGPNAEPAMTGGGGSSHVDPIHSVSVLAGIKTLLGDSAEVTRVPFTGPPQRPKRADKNAAALTPTPTPDVAMAPAAPPGIPAEYVDQIKAADVAVVCVGYNGQHNAYEGEGNDRTYALPQGQEDLIKSVLALNPKTIVILNAGGSVATVDWLDKVPAFIDAYYPGQEGGTAIAEILFGKTNPSGRLAFSWEKRWEDCASFGNYPTKDNNLAANTYKEGVFLGYRWFDSKPDLQPLFPFGFGLSYTTFEFSGLNVGEPDASGNITVTATIKNTGKVAGAEVAQLYVQPPAANVPRPVRELKGFTRLELQPGESKTAAITLSRDDLAYWDPGMKRWTLTPGKYVFALGSSSRDLPVSAPLAIAH